MKPNYPNLGLIEYIFKEAVRQRYPEYSLSHGQTIKADMFMQTWPNTATGFDQSGLFAGQAITNEYTTIISEKFEKETDTENIEYLIYGVFFGNMIGYLVVNPNEEFLEDMKNRDMKCLGEAKTRYKEQ